MTSVLHLGPQTTGQPATPQGNADFHWQPVNRGNPGRYNYAARPRTRVRTTRNVNFVGLLDSLVGWVERLLPDRGSYGWGRRFWNPTLDDGWDDKYAHDEQAVDPIFKKKHYRSGDHHF